MNKEEIKKQLHDLFYSKFESMNKELRIPYVREIEPGHWEIFDGVHTIHTGDAGKEEFDKQLQKAFEKIEDDKDKL